MKVAFGLGGGTTAVAVVLALGGFVWATRGRDAVMARQWDVPNKADFPIPFPLTDAEVAALRAERTAAAGEPADPTAPPPDPLAGVDLGVIARDRATERGKHLVESRLGCAECHGADFSGGTMVDSPAIGTLKGPNIGPGGVTKGWGPADWDRIVRHGVMHDGHTAIMPAQDFAMLSDRELSDVVTYIGSFPPSDAVIPPPAYGPVMTVLLAAGQVHPAAYQIDHAKIPPRLPPQAAADAVYGQHLAQSCQGCHGHDLNGGPIHGGDPAWPPAANLTPVGLQGWTYDDFDQALRHGKKKDGSAILEPMPWKAYAHLQDVEVQAIWAWLQTLPPTPTGT